MLILSRKPGDAIIIDGGIRVVVLACDRKGVRLGIEAPAEVTILRSEIVNAIADENRRANATADSSGWLSALPLAQPDAPETAQGTPPSAPSSSEPAKD
jgi:carbon storage regulator